MASLGLEEAEVDRALRPLGRDPADGHHGPGGAGREVAVDGGGRLPPVDRDRRGRFPHGQRRRRLDEDVDLELERRPGADGLVAGGGETGGDHPVGVGLGAGDVGVGQGAVVAAVGSRRHGPALGGLAQAHDPVGEAGQPEAEQGGDDPGESGVVVADDRHRHALGRRAVGVDDDPLDGRVLPADGLLPGGGGGGARSRSARPR